MTDHYDTLHHDELVALLRQRDAELAAIGAGGVAPLLASGPSTPQFNGRPLADELRRLSRKCPGDAGACMAVAAAIISPHLGEPESLMECMP